MERERLIDVVNRARQGDENAKEALYLDAYLSVYRFALRLLKNPEDAEDITQEVFIAVNEKICELREAPAFYKWVNQITVNRCNELLRRYKGLARLDDEEEFLVLADDDPLNLPDRAIDDEATRKIIMDVIDALPGGQRACVLYYYYSQFTIAQIADVLEINEGTVKSRLSTARAKIRAALEEKEKKEGIKLYGIPLALTPILRQAMEQMSVPDGLAERMWPNIQAHISPNDGPGAEGSANPAKTSGQVVPKPGRGGVSAANGRLTGAVEIAGRAAANMLIKKAVIALLAVAGAAAVVTAGIVLAPLVFGSSDNPGVEVSDAQPPGGDISQAELAELIAGGEYDGEYDADNLRSGYGVWVYGDCRYEGYWENGMPNGEGTLYKTNTPPAEGEKVGSYAVEMIIQGHWVNGFADGAITYSWHMDFGDMITWSFNVKNGYAAKNEIVYATNGVSDLKLYSGNLIAGVPPWAQAG